MDDADNHRTYFTVLDEQGNGYPAMAYVAATLDEEALFEVLPLKRFVKLICSGEHLRSLGDGRFIGDRSGRTYCARQG